MVAEFLERHHSTGSPVSGETPHLHHTMELPNAPLSLHQSVATALEAIDGNNSSVLPNQTQQQNIHARQRIHIHNSSVHTAYTSPSPPLNANTKLSLTARTNDVLLNGQHEPLSPQTSDSGNSISEHVLQMNSNSSSSSCSGKYGSGGASPNSSTDFYDVHMTKQSHQHKELFSQRKQREFIPDNKKDESYWDRRRRNNEAAKRSREKRRYNDMVLEQRVVELTKENHVLKAQLDAIRDKFNITSENLISVEQILASLPTSEQVLGITKRAKLNSDNVPPKSGGCGLYDRSHSETNLPAKLPGAGKDALEFSISRIKPNDQKFESIRNENVASLKSRLDTSHLINHALPAHHAVQHYAYPDRGNQISSPILPNLVATGVEPVSATPQSSPALIKRATHCLEEVNPQNFHSNQQYEQLHNAQFRIKHNKTPPTLQQAPNSQNLGVLKTFNCNIGSEDISNLRKVVDVVETLSANVTRSNLHSTAGDSSDDVNIVNVICQPATQASSTRKQHTSIHNPSTDLVSTPFNHSKVIRDSSPSSLNIAAVDEGCSAFPSASPIYNDTCGSVASVLNLSRRTFSHNYELLFSSVLSPSLSSSVCSGVLSGDEEHESIEAYEAVDEHDAEQDRLLSSALSRTVPITHIPAISSSNSDFNNSLPLKLRHKLHLGDKDAAATALLALQHIKQEPICNRSSPPSWADNGDNSSDERDSGISIGSNEWTAQFPRKTSQQNEIAANGSSKATTTSACPMTAERDHILKSQLARLETEVANIKNMIILTGPHTSVSPVADATATTK